MAKLFEIIKKNFRLLLRSKTSALIVLVGPSILMLLIGFAFNTTSLFDIKIGTYSSSYSELSDSITQKLQDEQFRVIKINSEEECINMVKSGDVHVCTIFPANLNIQTSDKIIFYVDHSRLNFVYIILDRISSKIATRSTELSTALTNRLLTSITNVDAKLDANKKISGELELSYNELSELDTTYSSANFSTLKKGIEDSNLDSDNKTKLLNLISSAQSSYSDIINKMDAITTTLDSVTTRLSGNINTAKEIETNIKAVKDDVSSIEIKDVTRIVSPISTEIKPISSGGSTNLNYTFPTLVLLVILFAGLLIGSTSVMEEKTSKAYFRNFITPTKGILFVFGQYISNIIIVLIQIMIIFTIMLLITDASLTPVTWLNVLLLSFLTGSIFILFGMIIGYLFKTGETANLATICVGALLLFFSNTILPIETLPTAIRKIVEFSPFILGEASLKKILLFNEGFSNITYSVYILIGFVVVLFALSYFSRELTKRNVS